MRTVDYLDALKARHALVSDYQLSKFMGWSKQRVSNYRKQGSFLDEQACIEVAEALDLAPEKVLADIQAERTSNPAARAVWQRVAQQYASKAAGLGAALVLALAAAVDAGQPAAAAAPAADQAPGIKIMLNNALTRMAPSVSD